MLSDRVYQQLRLGLMSGEFGPGERVSARPLAAQLGVSLTPVREALQRLLADGALTARAHASPTVPLFGRAELMEVARLRALIEGELAAAAAARITPNQLKRLEQLDAVISRAYQQNDRKADMAGLHRFSFAVYEAAGRPLWLEIASRLWMRTGPYLNLLYPDFMNAARKRAPEEQLRPRLIHALATQDGAEARAIATNGILGPFTYVAGLLDPGRPGS